MKIKRTINGTEVEIELTSSEMYEIYRKEKDTYTAEDIRSRYNVPDDKIEAAVERFEKVLGWNDSFWDSYWGSVEYVCEEMGFEERVDE